MLRIIISPAKKMNVMDEAPADAGVPRFLERTRELKQYLQSLDYETLKSIWKCNDKLARLNFERLREMELDRNVTPAVFAYEGIQYQSMAPMVFEQTHLDYIGTHLYILSGFYGILRAFDGVVPYRLEMQARLSWKQEERLLTSLYEYWGSSLYEVLTERSETTAEKKKATEKKEAAAEEKKAVAEEREAALEKKEIASEEAVAERKEAPDEGDGLTVLNLASQEYAKAVRPWVGPQIRFVECVFGEWDRKKGKVCVKATAAKMARGAMVRYMAEHQVERVEELRAFDLMGYEYREELSEENTMVFVKNFCSKERMDSNEDKS